MSRSFGGILLTTVPPMLTVPSPISSRPAIIRSSVDLPQPEGPTSTQNSPSAMAMSTPRMTCVEPKCLWTPAIETFAMLLLQTCSSIMGATPPAPRPARRTLRHLAPRPAASLRDHVIGPPVLKPRYEILRRLATQFALGLDGVERGMRREDDARVVQQPRFARHRLAGQHVQR